MEGGFVSGADLKAESFVDLLRWRGLNQSAKKAYIFLANGEAETDHFTFGELDRRARAIAASLQAQHAHGARVLLLFPSGLDYVAAICGCFYAGAIAVPVAVPQLSQSLQRIAAVSRDAQASFALTTAQILESVPPLIQNLPELQRLTWRAADDPKSIETEWRQPDVTGDTVALLQYTSGSTGTPKGVIITHGNLVQQSYQLSRIFAYEPKTSCVTWLPMHHNTGLIGVVLQVIYGGFPLAFMPPLAFLERPARWLEAITRYHATVSAGPNFAYDVCVSAVPPEVRERLDLKTWDTAINGAEPIRVKTIDRFVEAFGPCGFRREAFFPCYGLTESTLIVSGGPKLSKVVTKNLQTAALENNLIVETPAANGGGKEMVGSGQVMASDRVVIVNPTTLSECAPAEVGEIWARGPSVARGYWERLAETEETFAGFIATTGEGPFLRTGDLGYLDNRQLFVTGRLKDLIIIRGRNHYPQDIELTMGLCHPALHPGFGAAFSVEQNDEEHLVVVQELKDAGATAPEVIEAIRQAIAKAHGIQVHAVVLIRENSIPKTLSGKIQRSATRDAFLNNGLAVLAQWQIDAVPIQGGSAAEPAHSTRSADEIESWLAQVLAARIGVAPERIDKQKPITQFGLDSIAAIELMHNIESTLGVRLPMWNLLQGPSISELAAQAVGTNREGEIRFGRDANDAVTSVHPLSQGQKSLWFLHQMAPESGAYNVWGAVRIEADLNTAALRDSYQTLVDRHPALRTTFSAKDGEPIQLIHDRMKLWFHEEDTTNESEAALTKRMALESRRPFDLENGPLIRVYLFKRSEQEYFLMVVIHHTVVDLWSMVVFVEELGKIYPALQQGVPIELPPVAFDFADFVRWQHEMLASPRGDQLWSYWQEQLSGELPTLHFPTDRPHPPQQTFVGAARYFYLDRKLTQQVKDLGRAYNATPNMTMLAAFQMLVHRYSGQDDIIIGSPVIGRTRPEMARIVGHFVNPLPMRSNLSGDPTVKEFLGQVRNTVLKVFEHQDYPLALLTARLQPERPFGRQPIFQVMFVFQQPHLLDEEGLAALSINQAGGQMKLGELTLKPISLERGFAQFDLTMIIAEFDGQFHGLLEYNTGLFDEETVVQISDDFLCLLESIVDNQDQRVSQVQFISERQRRQLAQWNDTAADYRRTGLLHELFEAQAERTPNDIALVFADSKITYRELNRRANQLAHHLRSMGVGIETLVGIYIERGIEMIVGMLGILKAGGAYVPFDVHYPPDRIRFMLEDSGVRVLLTQQHLVDSLPQHEAQVLCLDSEWKTIAKQSVANPAATTSAQNLAYVIYTSGSTGLPKGVAIAHQSAFGLVSWARTVFSSAELAQVLASTSICFDLSVYEIFTTLASGGTIVVATDALEIPSLLKTQPVTLINTVPSVMTELLRLQGVPESVKVINLAGEPLTSALVEQIYKQTKAAKVWNLYGPSEDTTYSTFALIEQGAARAPVIGRPIANTQAYLLDKNLQLVPRGASGELYLGGEGLARGYLHRPELTAERFLPNPFSDQPGARMYRTGDVARYLSDGNLDFLGRIDHQVKIRGFRIELGEIETVLLKHESVLDAVITVREDVPGDKRIVAYVVLRQEATTTVEELHIFLARKLPDYMQPSAFLLLPSLPLTPNGKVDRKALPAPDRRPRQFETDFVAPRTETEQTLSGIWTDLLRIDEIGVHDNFFKMGGHSLLATQLISRVRTTFNLELPLQVVFERPTIAAMAEEIETIRWAFEALIRSTENVSDQRVSGEL